MSGWVGPIRTSEAWGVRPAPGAAVVASAPGKLIVMGEHAAVYGRPAVVAALGLRVRVRLEPLASPSSSSGSADGDGRVTIDLPDLGHRIELGWSEIDDYTRRARQAWEEYAAEPTARRFDSLRGADPAHVVKIALGETSAALCETNEALCKPREALDETTAVLGEPRDAAGEADTLAIATEGGGVGHPGRPSLAIRVESEIPVGSGFGSSAAVAVAVIAAFRRFCGAADDLPEVARLALEVERRQHGLPSGVDHAAVLYGGVVWAERDTAGELSVEPLDGAAERLRAIRIYDSGEPSEATGQVVEAVRDLLRNRPAWAQEILGTMEECVRECRRRLRGEEDGPGEGMTNRSDGSTSLYDLVRTYEAMLERLGVVPEPVQAIVRAVEAAGGAAKVSGAGSLSGDGAGSLLVVAPATAGPELWALLDGCRRVVADLGATGLRLETAS